MSKKQFSKNSNSNAVTKKEVSISNNNIEETSFSEVLNEEIVEENDSVSENEESENLITIDGPDVDFTVSESNEEKTKEEEELDSLMEDIKDIVNDKDTVSFDKIDKEKENLENKELENNSQKHRTYNQKVTFEKMFGYFWNGMNYSF